MGAQVLGVSCDSRFTLAAWKQAMGYETRLVSDFWPHGRIGQRYGVFDDAIGAHRRASFVLGADGTVRAVFTSPEIAQAREMDRYVEALKSL